MSAFKQNEIIISWITQIIDQHFPRLPPYVNKGEFYKSMSDDILDELLTTFKKHGSKMTYLETDAYMYPLTSIEADIRMNRIHIEVSITVVNELNKLNLK